ncbi:MAG: hypothetical protein KDB28_04970, partial [Tetrasphaera sp.]|nr:hypothetical protein [Tetrasphaera sp.]
MLAAESVARREGLGKETVRRWVVQAQVDGGQRQGATSEELAEIKELKAKVRRLEEDNEILRRASIFFARGQRRVLRQVLQHLPHAPLLDRGIDLLRHGSHPSNSKG